MAMRIVLLGYIVRGPLGGMCWHYLQYLLGLREMGHEVLFLEDSDNFPSCYDPQRQLTTTDPAYGISFINELFRSFGLQDAWAYYDEHRHTWHGLEGKKVKEYCKSADLVLNISNVSPLRDWWASIPTRVLIDTDPAFTQIRHLQDKSFRSVAERHTHFFSFGERIGQKDCGIPDDGFPWMPTRQPVVMEAWPFHPGPARGKWTSVMQWDSYTPREYGGTTYGMKSASFQPYILLPSQTTEQFELAVGSATTPKESLLANGWKLADPLEVTRTPRRFQEYIADSKGEFSIAKHGYVISRSGWFSERSAAYLASGRPVLAQDTGFSKVFPTDEGLFPFSTPEEVLEQIRIINSDYHRHCRMARELAKAEFEAGKVLISLINRISGTS